MEFDHYMAALLNFAVDPAHVLNIKVTKLLLNLSTSKATPGEFIVILNISQQGEYKTLLMSIRLVNQFLGY